MVENWFNSCLSKEWSSILYKAREAKENFPKCKRTKSIFLSYEVSFITRRMTFHFICDSWVSLMTLRLLHDIWVSIDFLFHLSLLIFHMWLIYLNTFNFFHFHFENTSLQSMRCGKTHWNLWNCYDTCTHHDFTFLTWNFMMLWKFKIYFSFLCVFYFFMRYMLYSSSSPSKGSWIIIETF